ncbi:unnamed protein product, partial [Discosporangium mesarthrocarpum]
GSDVNRTPITVCLLAAVTVIAVAVTDIGFVVGITGSLLGASICYIIPAVLFVKAHRRFGSK